jgi:hypothetical protein
MRNKFILSFFIALFVGCSNPAYDSGLGGADEVRTEMFKVNNSNKKVLSKINFKAEVKTITIPKELTLEVGSYFDGVFPTDDGVLLRDKRASMLSFIGYDGKLKWHVIPPSPGVDRYSTMGAVEINAMNERIEVYDEDRQVFDFFSLSGKYIKSHTPSSGFFDYTNLPSGKVAYDIGRVPVEGYFENVSGYYKFLISGEEDELVNKIENPVQEDVLPMVDLFRFKKIEDKIQYRGILDNTVFYLNDYGELVKKAVFDFTIKRGFHEVMKDNAVKNKGMFLYEKDLALPMHFVYEESENRAYCIFMESRNRYFVSFENGEQVNDVADYYDVEGVIVKAPAFFEDGYFILQMYKYEFDYLQSVEFEALDSKEELNENLRQMQNKEKDNSDIVLILMKF